MGRFRYVPSEHNQEQWSIHVRNTSSRFREAAFAVGIKFSRKQNGPGPDWVGTVDDDHVKTLVRFFHELRPVGDDDLDARIVKRAFGDFRQPLLWKADDQTYAKNQ